MNLQYATGIHNHADANVIQGGGNYTWTAASNTTSWVVPQQPIVATPPLGPLERLDQSVDEICEEGRKVLA